MEAVSLAPKPLKTPHPYDCSYQVPIRLDEPIWSRLPGPQDVAMEMMSHCLQLDSLLLSYVITSDTGTEESPSRRVTFQSAFSSKAASVIEQMKQCLQQHSVKETVEEYLRSTGLDQLFRRVIGYLASPGEPLTQSNSSIVDAYLSQVANLNNLLTMSQQLNTDSCNPSVHKYAAHQTALLYTCVNHLGSPLQHYKKEIESKFKALKSTCSSGRDTKGKLNVELQSWLDSITTQLTTESLSLRPDLLKKASPIISIVQHFSEQ